MARVAYTALFLNFAPDTTNIPKQADITNLITNYYKLSSRVLYGKGYYNATDSDTSDPKGILRSDEFAGELIAELSNKIQQWHDSGLSSDGQLIRMPSFKLSKEFNAMLKVLIGDESERITSIRMYGSDYDDMGVQ